MTTGTLRCRLEAVMRHKLRPFFGAPLPLCVVGLVSLRPRRDQEVPSALRPISKGRTRDGQRHQREIDLVLNDMLDGSIARVPGRDRGYTMGHSIKSYRRLPVSVSRALWTDELKKLNALTALSGWSSADETRVGLQRHMPSLQSGHPCRIAITLCG
jgi:hypothetical protein